MDYTCENCRYRNSWYCEDGYHRRCEDFELDESTLDKQEVMMLRVMRQIMRELREE